MTKLDRQPFGPATLAAVLLLLCVVLMGCEKGFMDQDPGPPPSSWERKDAFRMCKPMINGYPSVSSPSCNALHMCANEAILSKQEFDKLYEIIRATPGCAGP